ncbi:DUF1062 domain-containing protein [Micromonospora sp. C28SCA-DRY-2]|uniref:DUF1062 domain-containing protein n=1 Tax=Micromonospora sp. C28SCA-DRY-2 TaxID=3059522 RepID=UPI0026745BA4|nr:DUF1062 domain-containing protein [Micromonospora sp. C28SCA-DRY-2]MDO3701790.1 DUF1062 domain-containing protein [Micromonospora sp. C28SCA-DRY-2]
MSTRPHIVLSWTVWRTRPPLLAFACVHCRSGLAGDGTFRVSANGKLVDVWLLVGCVSCDRTSRVTVHDRVPVRCLDPVLLCGYLRNSAALVARVLLDPLIAQRNRLALKWEPSRELLAPTPPDSPWPVQAPVIVGQPVPVRSERLLAQRVGHQPRGGRSPGHDRHSGRPQHAPGLLVRPAVSRRRGPEPGPRARWPCPGPHHAALRARSLMTGRERRSGSARHRRLR